MNGTWHSYVAEITLGCGMSQWTRNQRIVHAVSGDPLSQPFERRLENADVYSTLHTLF